MDSYGYLLYFVYRARSQKSTVVMIDPYETFQCSNAIIQVKLAFVDKNSVT